MCFSKKILEFSESSQNFRITSFHHPCSASHAILVLGHFSKTIKSKDKIISATFLNFTCVNGYLQSAWYVK